MRDDSDKHFQCLFESSRRSEAGPPLSRRAVLGAFASASALSALPGQATAQVASLIDVTPRPPPAAATASPAGRYHPNFVKNLAQLLDLNATNQGGAWWNYDSFVTPVDQFFIRNAYATPRAASDMRVHRDHWRLKIHGDGIERELTISYNDLLRMPSRSIFAMMECAGNGRSLFWEQQGMVADPQKVGGSGWGLGGIGMAEWRYVSIGHILGLVGLKPAAKAALFWSGIDGSSAEKSGDAGRPLPIDMLTTFSNSIGLAFKMNGSDLLPDHGAPVRMIVPGWCGAASTKWVTEIKIATHDFWVRLNSSEHVMIGPDYKPPVPKPGDELRGVTAKDIKGQMVTWSPPRSLLTLPLVLEKQPQLPRNYPLKAGELPSLVAGEQMLTGYAWAPENGVKKVDVRINGRSWLAARLFRPLPTQFSWVRFEMPWKATAGRHLIETRVTDNSGDEQPATGPYNAGGFNFWAIPKFHVQVG